MNKPKFTPLPWLLTNGFEVYSDNGDIIATVYDNPGEEEGEANGYLITAAPDGYNILADLVQLFGQYRSQLDSPELDLLTRAEAYLSKAQGVRIEQKGRCTATVVEAVAYAELQRQMRELNATMDTDSEAWNADFLRVFAAMEAIKNRNGGYAPGTEPKENL